MTSTFIAAHYTKYSRFAAVGISTFARNARAHAKSQPK